MGRSDGAILPPQLRLKFDRFNPVLAIGLAIAVVMIVLAISVLLGTFAPTVMRGLGGVGPASHLPTGFRPEERQGADHPGRLRVALRQGRMIGGIDADGESVHGLA